RPPRSIVGWGVGGWGEAEEGADGSPEKRRHTEAIRAVWCPNCTTEQPEAVQPGVVLVRASKNRGVFYRRAGRTNRHAARARTVLSRASCAAIMTKPFRTEEAPSD